MHKKDLMWPPPPSPHRRRTAVVVQGMWPKRRRRRRHRSGGNKHQPCKKPSEVISFSLNNLYWVFWGLERCLQITKWLSAAGGCPDQVEHVMVGLHVSLLVEEKVTPKWTVLWLSQLFDPFNVLRWHHTCCLWLETWSILLVLYRHSNIFFLQDTSRHSNYGNFGDENHRFCLPTKQWRVW